MTCNVFLALGSNIGNREKYLKDAVAHISALENTSIRAISKIYETKPVGYTGQDHFLNMVIAVDTGLEPLCLLNGIQKIEHSLGRTREIYWGPRTIDIDILLFEDMKFCLPQLTIPHPQMLERAFVLVPLRDVFAGMKINGLDIDELINKCDDKNGIRLFKEFKEGGAP